MLPIKSLIKTAVHRAGITTQVTSAQLVAAVNVFLDAAVIKGLRPYVQVVSFQKGTLKVTCQNSVAAHEVRSLELGIRDAIIKADARSELKDLAIQTHSRAAYDI